MNKTFNTKDMVITALLIALGIMIPLVFTGPPLRVWLPPAFSATLTAHVPVFIAMFISPVSAVFTAIGTTIGFLFSGLPLVVVVRAASHIIFAVVGAYMIQKKVNLVLAGIVTAILHSLCEALVTFMFLSVGWSVSQNNSTALYEAYVTCVGTLLHHSIDYVVAVILAKALTKTKMLPKLPDLF